jgi:hypothetical protein
MNKLFTRVSAAASAGFVYLSLAAPGFAQVNIDPCPKGETEGTDFSVLCDLSANNIGTVISSVVTVLLIAAAIIALFFLIWGGIKWILSGGDKVKVDEARKTIIASIIGLIVALLAFFIITIVLGLFDLSLTDLKLPKLT